MGYGVLLSLYRYRYIYVFSLYIDRYTKKKMGVWVAHSGVPYIGRDGNGSQRRGARAEVAGTAETRYEEEERSSSLVVE